MTDPAHEHLTVAAAARLLGRSTEQVRRYLREGTLPGHRLGGQWFIQPADAEALLHRRAASPDLWQRVAMSASDPLSEAIAVGGSGGAAIANGRISYLLTVAGTNSRD